MPSLRRFIWPIFYTLLMGLLMGSAPIPDAGMGADPINHSIVNTKAFSNHWLRLLHYQKSTWGSGFQSLVDFQGFFFSDQGKTQPYEELLASRKAIQEGSPRQPPHNLDPICAFPARAKFMQQHFGDKLREVNCEGLEFWKKRLPLTSISLVFSTAYSGNPASLFGHTFIKLNVDKKRKEHEAPKQDYAISFAAVPDDSSSLIYMYKGLTGAYPGVFSISPYFEKITEYTQIENRDLWEYHIKLSPAQLELLLDHMWELVHQAYIPYYFLHDNCSYALLSLLEVLDPNWQFTHNSDAIVLPLHVVKTISQEKQLVQQLSYKSSLRKQFYQSRQQLSSSENQQLFKFLWRQDSPQRIDNPYLLETAAQYYSLLKAQHKGVLKTEQSQHFHQVLEQRAKIATPTTTPKEEWALNHPDIAHGSKKISLLYTAHPIKEWQLHLRYGYHDLLDNDEGYEPFLQIHILEAKLSLGDTMLPKISAFTLVDIVSLAPFDLLDPIFSWKVKVGSETRIDPYVEAGAGLALGFWKDQVLVYSLPSLHGNRKDISLVYPISLLFRFSERWKALVEIKHTRSRSQSKDSLQVSQQWSHHDWSVFHSLGWEPSRSRFDLGIGFSF